MKVEVVNAHALIRIDFSKYFPLAVGSNYVSVKLYSPGFQRKLMLWPIPVVRGEI